MDNAATMRRTYELLNGGDIMGVAAAATAGIPRGELTQIIAGAAEQPSESIRAGGFVLDTVGAAFWALANTRSARDAIELAVSLGEDADSTGAVTGAMAGAAYGATALPASWREGVQFGDRLQAEAARLLGLSAAAERDER